MGPLGAGGMGEVYRARDTRLGRNVAIKVLPAALLSSTDHLRRFENEARATAALSHPNILVVFDVGMHDGISYLVEELLEGETLRALLKGGPLPPRKAVELAVQTALGLAAAHDKGIIHRDLKPENLFVTRDGVAKILDFGLARLKAPAPKGGPAGDAPTATPSTEIGVVAGTAGYMAPEQARGQTVDQRTDIFGLGCVLYEMLSGKRAFSGATVADTISAILHEDPPPLSDFIVQAPATLERIVHRCLEKRPEDRFTSARDLAFALQAVVEAAPQGLTRRREEPRPYPGLAAFTEADAEHFFGREEEVAALWRKLPARKLLALIGPSGAGKTSFLRAGLVPHTPAGWRCLVATPGQAPFAALARALAPAFAGDPDAVGRLLDFHVPEVALGLIAQWRERADHGLVVIDQFEELFTLNAEDVHARFAELLGKIAALDGLHVLLAMRDDFLFGCHAHASLTPVFEAITPLGPPTGGDLRRAVVEPAAKLGFAFEDEALGDEILQPVECERGALPLLAFTLARLWEARDRERKLLTRQAYEKLGGVAGALVQHADATLERIGEAGVPIVREIFRNLTTAQQTRCELDTEELLSIFPEHERREAHGVLRELVDARLLTSFEVEGPDGSRHYRVEIVHESLLSAWPRLVRWRTEDEGSAQLRDQLRQAAHLWEGKRRPDDLLWTGTSYQEYQVWRSRYPGGLSEVEETFGRAMSARAGHRRRVRRLVVAAVLVVLLAVLGVVGTSLRRSIRETRRAEAEAAQREAAQLLALGRLRVADHPNVALAYAIASLDRADNGPARRFAVEALWQGPPALFLSGPTLPNTLQWSPDDRWLAVSGARALEVVSRETGERRQLSSKLDLPVGFTSDGRRLVTDGSQGPPTVLHVWALPEGRLERALEHAGASNAYLVADRLLTFARDPQAPQGQGLVSVRRLSLDGATQEVLGRWEPRGLKGFAIDPTGTWIVSNQGGRLLQQRLDALSAPGRVLGSHVGGSKVRVWPQRDRVVTGDKTGEVRIWDVPAARLERTLKSPADARLVALDPRGRFLATGPPTGMTPRSLVLFDLAAPRTAEPVPLVGSEFTQLSSLTFSPDGSWLGSGHGNGNIVVLWNMAGTRSTVIGRQNPPYASVAFTRDGDLLSVSDEGVLRRWLLSPAGGEPMRELWSRPGAAIGGVLEVDPTGRFAVMRDHIEMSGNVHVVPLDGSQASSFSFESRAGATLFSDMAVLDPSGRLLAVAVFSGGHPDLAGIRVRNLATGEERTLDTRPRGKDRCEPVGSDFEGYAVPVWLRDGRLLSDGDGGLLAWNLETGTSEELRPCKKTFSGHRILLSTPDSRMILRLEPAQQTADTSSLSVFDLASRETREMTSHGNRLKSFALDASGTILVTGGQDGVVKVGALTGEEPRLLFGHTGPVWTVAVSPDGHQIASGSDDGTIRLWQMPDFSKPPLHTLPHDELVAKLKSLTNLRAVRDPSSDTGWKIEPGPFPGWANLPEWQP